MFWYAYTVSWRGKLETESPDHIATVDPAEVVGGGIGWVAGLCLRIFEWGWLAGALGLGVLNRVLEPAPVWVIVPITFRVYWFVPILPLAAWAVIARRWRFHVPALIGAAAFFVLYGAQLAPRLPGDSAAGFTVMTYNVQRCYKGIEGVLGAVRDADSDVLALQETGCPEPDKEDLISRLESELGYACNFSPYYEHETSAGVAVCIQTPMVISNVQRRTYHSEGQWSFLFSEMSIGGRTVNVVVPHLVAFGISDTHPVREHRRIWNRLNWASRWHHRETAELLRLVATFKDPTIMAGDFNSTPGQAIHWRMRHSMTDAFRARGSGLGATFRFGLPIRIDYVYLSSELEPLAAEVGPAGASDHRPVIARVRLRP